MTPAHPQGRACATRPCLTLSNVTHKTPSIAQLRSPSLAVGTTKLVVPADSNPITSSLGVGGCVDVLLCMRCWASHRDTGLMVIMATNGSSRGIRSRSSGMTACGAAKALNILLPAPAAQRGLWQAGGPLNRHRPRHHHQRGENDEHGKWLCG